MQGDATPIDGVGAGSISQAGSDEPRFPEALLTGGDRRSIARSDRARRLVRANPARVSELVTLTKDHDWLVAMRAVDLLEKLAHEHVEWVEPYKRVFIGDLADSDTWEVHLQIVRTLPLFTWKRSERRRVVDILVRDVEHRRMFVKAWALDSLATFAAQDTTLMPLVRRWLARFEQSGSAALATRARHIRRRLSSQLPEAKAGP